VRTLRCMQVIRYTGTGLTMADRDRVTTTRLRSNVRTSPPQTALHFRTSVENNFEVLFHFIIHFVTTIRLHFEAVAVEITSLNEVHEVLGSRLC